MSPILEPLPPGEQQMTEVDVESYLTELIKRADTVKCKGLCAEACTAFKTSRAEDRRCQKFAVEHGFQPASLRKHLAENKDRLGSPESVCPYLKEGRCVVHDVRPVICVIYGASDRLPCPHGCEMEGPRLTDAETLILLHATGSSRPEKV